MGSIPYAVGTNSRLYTPMENPKDLGALQVEVIKEMRERKLMMVGWIAMLLVFSIVTESHAAKAKTGSQEAMKVADNSEAIRILMLDSINADSSKTLRMIPLPKHKRLRASLIHPDSIKMRVS